MAKILVVEDNALNIKLFCDLLAAHGHQTEAVLDSRDALEAARGFGPDLVITDIQLPHVSGLELMELIRKDADLRDVPIMAVTAYSGVGDDEPVGEAGRVLDEAVHAAERDGVGEQLEAFEQGRRDGIPTPESEGEDRAGSGHLRADEAEEPEDDGRDARVERNQSFDSLIPNSRAARRRKP